MVKNSRMQMVAILAVSLLRHSGSVLAPVLANIAVVYADYPAVWIQLLISVTTAVTIPALLLAQPLARKTSLKATAILAVAIVVFGGIAPLFINSFGLLMASRVVLGLGLGLLNPTSAALITENYEGELRTRLVGLRTAAASVGAMLLSLLSAWLVQFGWKAVTLSYLIGLPVLLLMVVFLPATAPARPEVTPEAGPASRRLSAGLVRICFFAFFYCIIMYIFPTNISYLVAQLELGGSAHAAVLTAIEKLSCFASGIAFSAVLGRLKKWSLPVATCVTALAMLLLSFANSFGMAATATALYGFATGVVLALMILLAGEELGPGRSTLGISLVTAGMNLGNFVSPVVMTPLFTRLFGQSTRGAFTLGWIAAALLTAVAAAWMLRRKRPRTIQ